MPSSTEAPNSTQLVERVEISIRSGRDTDWPLFASAFCNVYVNRRPQRNLNGAKIWPNRICVYSFGTPPHILANKLEALTKAPNWRLIVACPKWDDDEIMGAFLYKERSSSKRQTAGWITVKPKYQKRGVARALFNFSGFKPGEVD